MQSARKGIAGVILAGGAGRRIGGDKAQVMLGGVPLWRHVADRVGPQVDALAINGAGDFGDLTVVPDSHPGMGPLAGILAAMVWTRNQGRKRVLTVSVDTPFLPRDLAVQLSVLGRVVVAETDGGLHGTTAVWEVDLAEDLQAALEGGIRKVTDFADAVGIVSVRFEDAEPSPFLNINTPEDLARAEGWLE